MNICADCTEPNTTLHAVIKKDDTIVLYCTFCHSIPRCPDCDEQLGKNCDFECNDCGWFDKSRVWVCEDCGDTIGNNITECGCNDDDDDEDDDTLIDCSNCKRCIDMDKDAFHNIERIAPDEDGDIVCMNLCAYCWDLVGDAMLNNGWTNDP
jgi:hypothetical protein